MSLNALVTRCVFVTWQELKLHLSHLTADTLRRLRDNLAVPEPKPLQHSHISNIIDPPMPKVLFLSSSTLLERVEV